MRGVALVASSPVQHDSPVQHPIEVQSYRPPWKAFADYALHHDLDPNAPHFQHLVNQVSPGPACIDRSPDPDPAARANTKMKKNSRPGARSTARMISSRVCLPLNPTPGTGDPDRDSVTGVSVLIVDPGKDNYSNQTKNTSLRAALVGIKRFADTHTLSTACMNSRSERGSTSVQSVRVKRRTGEKS